MTPKNVILNEAKRSEESMTIMHCEPARLQCRGCFAMLSMTFTNAFHIETIFEIASNIKGSLLFRMNLANVFTAG
jgi:hypothetical protein